MSTSKYTPGPWIASGSQILQGGYMKEWKLEIASLPSRSDPYPKLDSAAKNYSERNANARLIAAAPDLLAALKDMLEISEGILPLGSTGVKARAAIAKAESNQ